MDPSVEAEVFVVDDDSVEVLVSFAIVELELIGDDADVSEEEKMENGTVSVFFIGPWPLETDIVLVVVLVLVIVDTSAVGAGRPLTGLITTPFPYPLTPAPLVFVGPPSSVQEEEDDEEDDEEG